jgi:hypothetical protein
LVGCSTGMSAGIVMREAEAAGIDRDLDTAFATHCRTGGGHFVDTGPLVVGRRDHGWPARIIKGVAERSRRELGLRDTLDGARRDSRGKPNE